ncbi:hypothetical protein [Azomonas macrocytogenes]|uniref:Uncharacterized protein n=1 Tax=Azomonas macrocytogenes TaxID=69962 RepID=A0A839T843_AZOMA|nr:hypothetical protein [Azomonas macrocytogenes]MBB3103833.1 hypothetical protein [Azomonas macrocytogenes]
MKQTHNTASAEALTERLKQDSSPIDLSTGEPVSRDERLDIPGKTQEAPAEKVAGK